MPRLAQILPHWTQGRLHWIVRAGNGRTIAVSTDVFADEVSAVSAFENVARSSRELTSQISHLDPGDTQLWRWQAHLAGAPIATSARPFARYGTCQSAFHRFLSTCREMRVAPSHDAPDLHVTGIDP